MIWQGGRQRMGRHRRAMTRIYNAVAGAPVPVQEPRTQAVAGWEPEQRHITPADDQRELAALATSLYKGAYLLSAMTFLMTLALVVRWPLIAYTTAPSPPPGLRPSLVALLLGTFTPANAEVAAPLIAYAGRHPLFLIAALGAGIGGLWLQGASVRAATRSARVGGRALPELSALRWIGWVGCAAPGVAVVGAYLCWPSDLAVLPHTVPSSWFYGAHGALPLALLLVVGSGAFMLCATMVRALTIHEILRSSTHAEGTVTRQDAL